MPVLPPVVVITGEDADEVSRALAPVVARRFELDRADPVALRLERVMDDCRTVAGLRVVAVDVASPPQRLADVAGWWSVDRTAQVLAVSPARVTFLARRGRLRGTKPDGWSWSIDPDSVEAYKERRTCPSSQR